MSHSQVVEIFNRADLEKSFKNLLINDPDAAFVGYDLTESEKEQLRTLTAENYDLLKGQWIPDE